MNSDTDDDDNQTTPFDDDDENVGFGLATADIRTMLERHLTAVRRAQVVRQMGTDVTRIVQRLEDATRTGHASAGQLDLSKCQLVQMPDAVYYMTRDTRITRCNLSGNAISRLTRKMCLKFAHLQNLDVSHNKLSTLPDALATLTDLQLVDISHNVFAQLPSCLLVSASMRTIIATHNFITDVGELQTTSQLTLLDIRDNPLRRDVQVNLGSGDALAANYRQNLSGRLRILISNTLRETEDWEDLSI